MFQFLHRAVVVVFKPCRPRLVVIIIPWGLHAVVIGLAQRHLCIVHPFRKLETLAPSGGSHWGPASRFSWWDFGVRLFMDMQDVPWEVVNHIMWGPQQTKEKKLMNTLDECSRQNVEGWRKDPAHLNLDVFNFDDFFNEWLQSDLALFVLTLFGQIFPGQPSEFSGVLYI